MWIFSVLPDIAIHAIFVIGLLGMISGIVLGFIPLVKQYKLAILVISGVILSFGLYLEGGLADNKIWQAKILEVEAKLAKAEAQSQKENIKIVEKVVTKTKIVKERGEEIIKYVDREIVKYDTKFLPGGICEIPKEFIKAHNDAAEPPKEFIKAHNDAAEPPK
jgi:hypothetical protein